MNVKLWEVSSSGKAILFSTLPKSDEGHRTLWIPKSQINHISRDAKISVDEWTPCLVDVADWLVEKESL